MLITRTRGNHTKISRTRRKPYMNTKKPKVCSYINLCFLQPLDYSPYRTKTCSSEIENKMSVRNQEFPLERDLYIGDTWMSEIMNQFHTSIQEQTTLLGTYRTICHAYYRRYVYMHRGVFLNNHDLDNLCQLFNDQNPHATTIIGREYIFFLYSRIISDIGQVELNQQTASWLENKMQHLNLTASVDLSLWHPGYQAPPPMPQNGI